MFLKNYDHICTARKLAAAAQPDSAVSVDTDKISIQTTGGSVMNSVQVDGNGYGCGSDLVFSVKGIILGEGDTPVTYDDYKLSGKSYYGTSEVSRDVYLSDDKKNVVIVVSFKYSNDTDSDITIKEWGIMTTIRAYNYLVFREVLETPYTIKANSVAQMYLQLEVPHEVNRF